jgi:hypothetical protein
VIPMSLHQVDIEVIGQLITDQVAETAGLDYKQALPDTDSSKKRFLKCMTGLANTGGGDLVLGVTEKRPSGHKSGLPGEACGLADTTGDEAIRRVTDLVRMGTDPPLVGIEARAIDGFPLGPVVVLRVAASWVGPHMVVFGGDYRFYGRSGASTYEMRSSDLRRAFTLTASMPDMLRDFRLRRLNLILDPEGPLGLDQAGCVVLHVVPLSALDESAVVDLASPEAQGVLGQLSPMVAGGWNRRFNIDGYLAYASRQKKEKQLTYSFVQVLRRGAVEAANTVMFDGRPGQAATLRPAAFEIEIAKAILAFWRALRALGCGHPAAILLSLMGVKGAGYADLSGFASGDRFDRSDILVPEVLIDEMNPDVPSLMKPAFDAVAQAAGAPFSGSYGGDGRWLHYEHIRSR